MGSSSFDLVNYPVRDFFPFGVTEVFFKTVLNCGLLLSLLSLSLSLSPPLSLPLSLSLSLSFSLHPLPVEHIFLSLSESVFHHFRTLIQKVQHTRPYLHPFAQSVLWSRLTFISSPSPTYRSDQSQSVPRVHEHTYTHICSLPYTRIHMCVFIHISIRAHPNTIVYLYAHTCIHIPACTHVCTHVNTRTHTCK